MRLAALYATSIICGFCMMALEIVGGRYVQNFFGSSIDVWAAIISVFILSLSVGYVVGGRIADHSRSSVGLGWIIVAASLFYLTMPIYGLHFQAALGEPVHTARWGVLVAALALYLPPSLLLGMVSPILVKLVFTSAERVGRSTGTLYAVGSIGNVIGILVSDYLLLAWFDLNHIIYAMGAVLAVLGLIHLVKPIAIAAVPGEAQPAQVAP